MISGIKINSLAIAAEAAVVAAVAAAAADVVLMSSSSLSLQLGKRICVW
jgi:hypothetical protein